MSAAILDIDGTLVDTNYHHTIAWARAFRRFEIDIAVWRIHRHIGMGGDQVVTSLCGQEVEDEHGDDIRSAEAEEYGRLIDEVRPMKGSRELIVELKRRGHAAAAARPTVPNSVRKIAPVGQTSRQAACVQCLQTSEDISQRKESSSRWKLDWWLPIGARCSMKATWPRCRR